MKTRCAHKFVPLVLVAGPLAAGLPAVGCRPDPSEPGGQAQTTIYRPPTGPADPDIKHVILISIDTLRADRLGCYGHQFIKTPHIDQLAAEGVLFEQHVNAAPTTLNSHTCLMTGTYPHTHGAPRNGFILNDQNVMLAEVLKENGFTTAAFIGAYPLHSRFNFAQGFDYYDEHFEIIRGQAQVDQDQRIAARVTDSAVAWLEENRPRRMFLFVHYFDVHWPYAPPPPYDRLYRQDDQPFGGSLMEIGMVRKALYQNRDGMQWQCAALDALYCGEVTYTDTQIGRLFEVLRQGKLYDESLIVLTADHGEAMNEHWEIWDHGFSTYQTTISTPLIIRQPGGKLGGTRYPNLLSNIDVMPTILDRLGLGHPQRVEGVSFAPLLDGQEVPPRRPVFAEATKPFGPRYEDHPLWTNALKCRAVCTPRYKFIYRPIALTEELFDLQADPQEQDNLLQRPNEEIMKRAGELSKLLQAWGKSAKPLDSTRDDSKETVRKLRALGYMDSEGYEDK